MPVLHADERDVLAARIAFAVVVIGIMAAIVYISL